MREIKFRAWDRGLGLMVTGDSDFIELEKLEYEKYSFDRSVYLKDEWYPARNILAIFHYFQYMVEHDDIEVMQYTGLKDKNGVEIYEGDVVRYGWFAYNDAQTYGEEPWDNLPDGVDEDLISRIIEPAYQVKWVWKELENLRQMVEGNPDVFGVEVIGNIYENPELLEGKK